MLSKKNLKGVSAKYKIPHNITSELGESILRFEIHFLIDEIHFLGFPAYKKSSEWNRRINMESAEEVQLPQLALANKIFLLNHHEVSDIDKVRLHDEVLNAIKSDSKFLFFFPLL